MKNTTWLRTPALVISAAVMVVAAPAAASPARPASPRTLAALAEDVIVLKDGTRITGTIIEETDELVTMRIKVAGIAAVTTYARDQIASITRTSGPEEVSASKGPAIGSIARVAPKPTPAPDDGKVRVYVIPLEGVFGRDISQTPMRQAIADARKKGADYLIFKLNNDWSDGLLGGLGETELPDDMEAFDQLFRTEEIEPVITKEIPKEWEKQPRIVFWVRNAMGGGAFLPLASDTIYFHSEGRMGGIGGIAQLFEGIGDEVVREKQRSLRMGHAHGMAIQGGYDTRVVDAMARMDYVLSYAMVGGEPVFFERLPEGNHETLLSDNGMLKEYADAMEDRVRGRGNDVLTLKPGVARDLGISKGTVDTLDDLLFELEIHRNYVLIDGRAEDIMKQWRDGMHDYPRNLRRLWIEFEQIAVRGDFNERKKGRGAKMGKLRQIKRLCQKFIEAIDPRQVPPEGYPPISQVNLMIEVFKLQQLADQK